MEVQNTKTPNTMKPSMVIIGAAGVGKTTLAKTLKGKTIIISAESGLLSLQGNDIDYISISSINDLRETIAFLNKENDYENLFIDSLTEISRIVLDEMQAEFPDKSDSLKMFGKYSQIMRKVIITFRDFEQYNVIMTALPKVDKDETNRRFITADLTGKVANQLPAYFDLVMHYDFIEDERTLRTMSNERIIAKDRSGKLNEFEKPDLQLILNKIGE